MCEKFHYDRLRHDKALGNRKSDNNKKRHNVGSHWRPVSVSVKIGYNIIGFSMFICRQTNKTASHYLNKLPIIINDV